MSDERVRVVMSRAEPGGRVMSKAERIEASHVLRSVDDIVLAFIRSLEPAHGMAAVTDLQFNAQIDSLVRTLEWLRLKPGEPLVSEPETRRE